MSCSRSSTLAVSTVLRSQKPWNEERDYERAVHSRSGRAPTDLRLHAALPAVVEDLLDGDSEDGLCVGEVLHQLHQLGLDHHRAAPGLLRRGLPLTLLLQLTLNHDRGQPHRVRAVPTRRVHKLTQQAS